MTVLLLVYGLMATLLLLAGAAGRWQPGDAIAVVALVGTDNEIFTVDTRTGVLHNLTHSPAQEVSFSWSPDGREMIFVRREDTSALYLMQASGRGAHQQHIGTIPFFPVWSPDGTWISFPGNRATGLPDIFVMPAAGGAARNLTDTPAISEQDVAWLPDSSAIVVTAYTGGGDVLRIEPGSGQVRRWIDNATLPRAAPDGRAIAFIRLTDGRPAIWLKYLDDGREVRLDTGDGTVAAAPPAWSPDGRSIALVKVLHGRTLILVLDVATGRGRAVATLAAPVQQVVWSPDGTRLALLTETAIELLEVATGTRWRLIDLGRPVRQAAWRPHGV